MLKLTCKKIKEINTSKRDLIIIFQNAECVKLKK